MTDARKPKPKSGPFVVWSPDGPTPPKVAHKTHGAAHFAAHAMAKAHPGQTFMVMAKAGKAVNVSADEEAAVKAEALTN